jgi:hypothetical protein
MKSDEALRILEPQSLLVDGLASFWLPIAIGIAWLLVVTTRRRTFSQHPLSATWLLPILAWGVHFSVATAHSLDVTCGYPPATAFENLLDFKLIWLYAVVALVVILLLIVAGSLATHGEAVTVTPTLALVLMATIMTPFLDWNLAFFLVSPELF